MYVYVISLLQRKCWKVGQAKKRPKKIINLNFSRWIVNIWVARRPPPHSLHAFQTMKCIKTPTPGCKWKRPPPRPTNKPCIWQLASGLCFWASMSGFCSAWSSADQELLAASKPPPAKIQECWAKKKIQSKRTWLVFLQIHYRIFGTENSGWKRNISQRQSRNLSFLFLFF